MTRSGWRKSHANWCVSGMRSAMERRSAWHAHRACLILLFWCSAQWMLTALTAVFVFHVLKYFGANVYMNQKVEWLIVFQQNSFFSCHYLHVALLLVVDTHDTRIITSYIALSTTQCMPSALKKNNVAPKIILIIVFLLHWWPNTNHFPLFTFILLLFFYFGIHHLISFISPFPLPPPTQSSFFPPLLLFTPHTNYPKILPYPLSSSSFELPFPSNIVITQPPIHFFFILPTLNYIYQLDFLFHLPPAILSIVASPSTLCLHLPYPLARVFILCINSKSWHYPLCCPLCPLRSFQKCSSLSISFHLWPTHFNSLFTHHSHYTLL